MSAEIPDSPVDQDLEELKAMQVGIETRADLVRFLDVVLEDLESGDEHEGDELAIVLLEEIATVVGTKELLYGVDEKKLPETPTWKTFGDVIWDAVVRI